MRENGFINGLRQDLLSRVDPSAREAVGRDLDRLAGLGVASFQEALAVAQSPQSPAEDRAIAVWSLGQVGEAPPHMRLILAELLATEHDERVVWELAKAVVTAPDPQERLELAGRLSTLLGAPRPPEKRKAIAFALGLLGDARAVEPLAKVLREAGETFGVCEVAAEALANLGGPAAVQALEALAAAADSLHQEIVLALTEAKERERRGE
ncbi:MAG: HEAT repeat domain-containing protein [Thermoanaerobaculia bacterium]